MKKLIKYKVITEKPKTVAEKVVFNKDHYVEQLKKEIGLSDIPTKKLGEYTVQLNSPTGRSCSFSVNAKEYVDKELSNIEKSIKEFNEQQEDESGDLETSIETVSISIDESQEKLIRETIEKSDNFHEWIEDEKLLKAPEREELPLEKFKYFKTDIGNVIRYVVLFDNETRDYTDQYNAVKGHFCTSGQVDRNFLMGNEVIINYLQWVGLVSKLTPPAKDVMNYEDISKRMDNIFQGVEGLDLPEGFK